MNIYQKSSARPGDNLVIDPTFQPFSMHMEIAFVDTPCEPTNSGGQEYCRWYGNAFAFPTAYTSQLGIDVSGINPFANYAQAYINPFPSGDALAFEIASVGTVYDPNTSSYVGRSLILAFYDNQVPVPFQPEDSASWFPGLLTRGWESHYLQDYVWSADIGYNFNGIVSVTDVSFDNTEVPEPSYFWPLLLSVGLLAANVRRASNSAVSVWGIGKKRGHLPDGP